MIVRLSTLSLYSFSYLRLFQSGPSYSVSATYVPSLSRNQLERLLNDDDVDAVQIASHVERAKDKARTWLRVTKVVCTMLVGSPCQLDGIHTKLASVE